MMYLNIITILYCLTLKVPSFAQQKHSDENLSSSNDSELAEQLCILFIFKTFFLLIDIVFL